MKRRFVGTVLAGIGILFVVVAVGLPVFVAPAVTKLPNDMEACPPADKPQPDGCVKPSFAEATGATFLQVSDRGIEINQGTLRSTTEVLPRPDLTAEAQEKGELTDDAVVWEVFSTTARDNGEKINKYSTSLALDRVSGAAVQWQGQWLDDANLAANGPVPLGNISYAGQVYKFPFGTEKDGEYQIYDRDLRQALPVQFKDVAFVDGVEAYRFEQVIDRREVAMNPTTLAALIDKFAPEAESAKMLYSNTRTVLVEPVTGAWLDVTERQRRVFVPDTGPETLLLDARFQTTAETVDNSVASANSNLAQLRLIKLYLPIGAGIVGVVLLVGGLILMRPGPRPPFEAGSRRSIPRSRRRHAGQPAEARSSRDGVLNDTIPGSTPTWTDRPQGG